MMNKYFRLIAFSCIILCFTTCKKEETVFNVIPPSEGGTLTLNGLAGGEIGGQNALNSVFVDFSADIINAQIPVARTNWDLAFYSGGGEFRVILNHSTGATALPLNKTDVNLVVEGDTTNLEKDKTLDLGKSISTVDQMTGDQSSYLSGTVFKEVSATPTDNKVFIINRGISGGLLRVNETSRGWEKVQVERNSASNGYTIHYAKIKDKSVRPLEILKDPSFNFKYLSFSRGVVVIEPAKALWDIEWTYSTYKTDSNLPAGTPDFVLINFLGGAQAAQLIFSGAEANSTVNYEDFTEANLTGITYSGERDVIGTHWRSLSTANGTVMTVLQDRFYLVKDPAGNVYKLRFSNGVRGKPVIEFKLVSQFVAVPPN